MTYDGYTIAIPACDEHPPLRDWPAKALIERTCPQCGHGLPDDDRKMVRELKARRMIEEKTT